MLLLTRPLQNTIKLRHPWCQNRLLAQAVNFRQRPYSLFYVVAEHFTEVVLRASATRDHFLDTVRLGDQKRHEKAIRTPPNAILTLRNTSWYDWTAFWNASSAIICVSPFMNAWKRFVIVSRFCFVTFCCRLVISLGCLLLNGYDTHRETNTYSWMRLLRSSSSILWRSASSTGSLGCSLASEGDGDVGRCICWVRSEPVLWAEWSWDAGERLRLRKKKFIWEDCSKVKEVNKSKDKVKNEKLPRHRIWFHQLAFALTEEKAFQKPSFA